ncbi:MAG: hypothetical protein Q9210_007287, partial [Variospora velana]
MAAPHLPDEKLVYLYCSSIFSGANAQIRRLKVVTQRLQEHKASIRTLENNFPLTAIASVVQCLLKDRIFASSTRARRRFPELCQPSEDGEVREATSNVEDVKSEPEAAQGECDGNKGGTPVGVKGPQKGTKLKDTQSDDTYASSEGYTSVANARISRSRQKLPKGFAPEAHRIDLPFRMQHKLLVNVQTLLEECCFNFGKIWLPVEMDAQGWHEAESVELSQWTDRFLGPLIPRPSAIKPIPETILHEVVGETRRLRHAAVHRSPTSANEIVKMLGAAVILAETLNDSDQARTIAEMKRQVELGMKDIMHHNSVLERRLTGQLKDIAHRKAELDSLEGSFRETMAASDRMKRTEIGSALEDVLTDCHPRRRSCICNERPDIDGSEEGDGSEEPLEARSGSCDAYLTTAPDNEGGASGLTN